MLDCRLSFRMPRAKSRGAQRGIFSRADYRARFMEDPSTALALLAPLGMTIVIGSSIRRFVVRRWNGPVYCITNDAFLYSRESTNCFISRASTWRDAVQLSARG